MSGNDFDDFFEVDTDSSKEGAPKEEAPAASKPKPAQAKPAAPAAPPPAAKPAAKPAGTDDKMLSDFGDFDALFDKAGSDPAPAASPSAAPSAVEDLLSDFNIDDKTQALDNEPVKRSKPAAPPPPAQKAPAAKPAAPAAAANVEDLFDEFMSADEQPTQAKAAPTAKPAAAPPPPPKAAPARPAARREEPSQPEEALEELFSEVSESPTSPQPESEPSGEVLESGLGLEYKERSKKLLKPLLIAVPSLVVVVLMVAVGMARFTSSGFFGWKFGQGPKDGYQPPSGSTLKKLTAQYAAAAKLLANDNYIDYKKAEQEFESIIKVDPRHSPTDARLAEVILLMGDKTISAAARKRAGAMVEQSEKYHPEIIETLRSKARLQYTDGQLTQAESLAKRALSLDTKDSETLTLLGEIALSKGDLDAAAGQFNQVVTNNPKWPRAQHFLAVVKLQQAGADDAEKILVSLVQAESPHASSEIELYRLRYTHRKNLEEAKAGLKTLVETKAAQLSPFDLGRAWRSLGEIFESQSDHAGAIAALEKSVEADRGSHSNGFYLGRLYLDQKQFEKAAGEFGRASSLSPQTPEYLIYEGNALREMGKQNESLGQLQKALEKEPLNVEGLYQLGLTQRALSRSDESITSFENVLKSDPRHIDSLINLGELYLTRDNFTMAKTNLNSAITLSPQSVRAHNALGEVYLTTRKVDEALEEFKKAEAQDAKNVSVLSNMGRTYLALNNTQKASDYFEKALAIDPARLETQVALGELQHRKKEYIKAMETYRDVLKARPKDFETRVKLAQVLIDQNSFQDAITELQEASKWNPNYFATRMALGVAWRGLGNLDASLEQLNYALQVRPEAADAHYQVVLTNIYRNDPVNAVVAMEKAIGFDPKFQEPLIAMGDFFDSKNIYGKAAEYYIRAEKVNPRNTQVLLKIAESFRKDDKLKQAKVYFAKALGVNKNLSEAYLGMGLIEEDEGHEAKAIALLKRAQASDPDDPKPYYYLGFLYKDSDNKQAAILAFKKYLKLDPGSKEKQDIEDTIYALSH